MRTTLLKRRLKTALLPYYSWFHPRPRNFQISDRDFKLYIWWGKHFRVSPEYEVLISLEAERFSRDSWAIFGRHWLVRHRDDLRWVLLHGKLEVIAYYMGYCPPEMIGICAWLISKRSTRFRLYHLDEIAAENFPHARWHLAKALRRLEAWPALGKIAKAFPSDDRVGWYATAPPNRRPFAARLSNFIESVDDSNAGEASTPSAMPYWAEHRSWEGRPAKSVEFIRRVLQRIKHWVRGPEKGPGTICSEDCAN